MPHVQTSNFVSTMRVFELFSGIGGIHFAFRESGIEYEVVSALDINTTANSVYRHNFPNTNLMENNIEGLTEKHFEKFNVEMITMSPPCQPYTRQGHQKGDGDARNAALSHILTLIPRIATLRYLLMENVVGFEVSGTREQLTSVLKAAGFTCQEFVLSPVQLGIPNSRNRYYLLAKKGPFKFEEKIDIQYELPFLTDEIFSKKFQEGEGCFKVEKVLSKTIGPLVPDKVLKKYAEILDIVTGDCNRTCCFTKGYSHYAEGTGSIFCPFLKQDVHRVFEQVQNIDRQSPEYLETMKSLGLRYFSAREVARLMCFPECFSFPDNVSVKQKYRLLGNSVNVHVVAVLIKILTT